MSDILAIKHRAASIKNIGKITKSLETVSAMQLKNTEKKIAGTKEYFNALIFLSRKLAATGKSHSLESLFSDTPKNAKRVLFLVVSTDRGLVGAQNLSLFWSITEYMKQNDITNCDFMTFGTRGSNFGKLNGTVLKEWKLTNRAETAQTATDEIVELFKKGLYSHIYLAYNEFITMQNITTNIEQFLPIHLPETLPFKKEVIEPSIEEVVLQVTNMYLAYVLKHAFLEAEASEHAARTLAMKSASDNARELSAELTHAYNTSRQEAVTEEILEGAFHHG